MGPGLGNLGSVHGPMTSPNDDQIRQALNRLLEAVVGPSHAAATSTLQDDPNHRLRRCIERVQAEASEGAALVAECAPHGRAMLTQAQHKLATLEALQVMAKAARSANA